MRIAYSLLLRNIYGEIAKKLDETLMDDGFAKGSLLLQLISMIEDVANCALLLS